MKIKTILLAAVALGLLSAVAASAAQENLVFILDASNSMNKPFVNETRIDAAKGALGDLLGGMPTGRNVGLMVYGNRISHDNRVESCQDISFLFPIAALSDALRADMINALGQITAQGMTPLADSLTIAANELVANSAGGIIVLVSDGEGNCGGQPLVVAKMIATLDPRVLVHVVGIDIDPEASETLRALAAETGGDYWSVNEADALLDALLAAIGQAAGQADSQGTVQGGIPPCYAQMGITNVIYGTEGDDVLYGTPGNDLIYGLSGDDFLIGLGGNDVLLGGPGRDILEGGLGNDLLDGGTGDDLMFGGAGNDLLCGAAGNDSLEGDAGDDVLDGGAGSDALLGGTGKDKLFSADAMDILMEGDVTPGAFGGCPSCEAQCPPPAPVCPPKLPAPAPACPPTAPQPAPAPQSCATQGVVKVVDEGSSITLHGTATDYDCNILQVLWEVSAGKLSDPSSLDPVYTAPMLGGCDDADVRVSLTAVDSCGASACDSFLLRVRNVNHAPVASAGDDLWVDEGSAVVLLASASDPDGDALSYQWTVGGGVGVFEDSNALRAVYHAPMIDVCEGISVQLLLTVVDACGATVCDTVTVHIRNVNDAPTVDLGPDFSIDEGTSIRLTPVVADPQCDELTYCWTVTGGMLSSTATMNPSYTAPMTAVCSGIDVTLTLTVKDPCGLTASDSVKIHVRDVNRAPTVELGPNLSVAEGCTLQLSPQITDPDGDALEITWCVSAGRLDSSCMPAPVFIAPVISDCSGIDVAVSIEVTDPCGLTATDTMVIHVQNVNQPPVVIADP